MPLQRPANYSFTEAATRVRRYHGWTIHDTNTAAAAATASSSSVDGAGAGDGTGDASFTTTLPMRRPSMRPLDYRWDRSRGIVFSGHNQRRTYASKPIQRSTPASPPSTAPTKGFGPSSDSSWKGSFGSGAGSVYSVKQGKDLEKKNRELNEEIKGLQARIKEQKAKAEIQESQIATFKSQVAEMDSKLDSAKSKAARDLRDQKGKHQMELETVMSRNAGNQGYIDRVRREARAPLYDQINRLNQAQEKSQRELEALKTAMEDQQKRHENKQRNSMTHSRDLNIALDKAKKEISGFRARKQEDREDYTRYQAVFADLNDKIFEARDEVHHTRRRIEEERQAWKKSSMRFKTSANLRLFLHSSKYAGIKKAIEEYLLEQVEHAETTDEGMRQLESQLTQGRSDMQPNAHDSRALTRHHQFDEHQSAYNSAHLAQRLANSVPFQHFRKAYTDDIDHLRTVIEEASRKRDNGDVVEGAKNEMQDLVEAKKKVQRFLKFFAYVQEWRAMEALQDDDIVEKAVWVDTIKAKRGLDAAIEKFYDEIEDSLFQSAEEWTRRNNHRDDVRAQRQEFDHFVSQVRQRHLLAHDLGKMKKRDQTRVEETIRRQTDLAKSAVDGSLAGLGFQKPAVRRRTSIQLPTSGEIVTTTTADASSGKPVPTLETLRANLLTKVSTKRARSALVEKRPIVLKRPPRKALASRKKKFPGIKKVALDSSPEKQEPKAEAATGDKAKAKADVSDGARSTFKSTKPLQAKYSRPAYDIGDTSSKVRYRASRGGDMGFSTLKAALARHVTNSEESEPTAAGAAMKPPTEAVDDNEVSASEDSASTFDESSPDTPSEADEKVPEEPQTFLSYQIPPKDYRDAAMASPNSNAAYWSHNLYNNAENQKPVVYYCQSYEATEAKAKLFLNEPVLGFDMEWELGSSTNSDSPNIKRAVSLIQIAAEDKIGLFQIARFRTAKTAEEHMPPSLRKILESADIVKAGVNISGDSTRLKKCLGVEMQGIFELSHMYKVVNHSKENRADFKLVSLMQQVQDVLLLPLKKDDVRVSAWSKELNTQQTSYAAADAYAGFQLYHRLDNARKKMDPKPPRPAFFETLQPLVLGDGTMVLRSSYSGGRKKTVIKKGDDVVEEAEEEDEESFDAAEEIDTYELGPEPEISGSIPNPDETELGQAAQQEISYPTLPLLDPASGKAAGSASTTSAPSRSTTLPLRAKLTSKPAAVSPSQAAVISYPADVEDEIVANRSSQQYRPGPLPCPENQAAETWIITHRAKHPTFSSIGTPTLRAYHLWHHQHFDLREVAGFCRDPPLAILTVASYIVQALKEGGLPFEKERVKEVLEVLPGSVHGRYRGVLERGGVEI